MENEDPRAVLGLPLDATRGEAQRAFRRLAKQTHPDAGGKASDFQAVMGAWDELTRLLPAEKRLGESRPKVPSPHVLAYQAAMSRVVWAETRPARRSVRRDDEVGDTDFARVLQAEMARLAA
jgi:hypothetical protein